MLNTKQFTVYVHSTCQKNAFSEDKSTQMTENVNHLTPNKVLAKYCDTESLETLCLERG